MYTLLPITRRRRRGVPSPTVHLRTVKSNKGRLCFVGKEIYRRLKLFRYLNNISILPLFEQFSEMSEISTIFGCLKNIKLLECEQITYHFKARDL